MSRATIGPLFLITCAILLVVATPLLVGGQNPEGPLGIFQSQTDVGTLLHPSVASYDAAKGVYTITASGNNMWATEDDFHFVWKKMSGDVVLAADISILGQGGNPHKKGVLMIRQSLDPDSVYVDVALHANGLTALQFRDEKGAVTHDIEMSLDNPAPKRLLLEKRGDRFSMMTGPGDAHPSGASIHVAIQEPFYVGIGMCAHDKDVVETGVFTNVELTKPESTGRN